MFESSSASRVDRIRAVREQQKAICQESDDQIILRSRRLRERATDRAKADELLIEAFALAMEASRRAVGKYHYDEQIDAGIHLAKGRVVEMATGEGKTMTSILPLFLHALYSRGCHLATANDYLARRDAEFARPILRQLGLRVGLIQKSFSASERRAAYAAHVTYGTASEFGFDYLRDYIKKNTSSSSARHAADFREPVHRFHHFLLVDEADSVMLDGANTPLVLGVLRRDDQAESDARLFAWAAELAEDALEGVHYVTTFGEMVQLTVEGRNWLRECPDRAIPHASHVELCQFVERAIQVNVQRRLDEDYVLASGRVAILDPTTGRLTPNRSWRAGVQQAVQARDGIPIEARRSISARSTLQQFVACYENCAGMTGTAWAARAEFREVYEMDVVRVQTRLACKRKNLPPRFCNTRSEKYAAIAREVADLNAVGRPVLIGTPSIPESEAMAAALGQTGVAFEVLHARDEGREAEIVAKAGQRGAVTIATNIAGRGTDIRLGESVPQLGGLHVVIAELGANRRIDEQFIGRCARQGDPGSFRYYLSAQDRVPTGAFLQPRLARCLGLLTPRFVASQFRWLQWFRNLRQRRQRRRMLEWETQQNERLRDAGLDAILDHIE